MNKRLIPLLLLSAFFVAACGGQNPAEGPEPHKPDTSNESTSSVESSTSDSSTISEPEFSDPNTGDFTITTDVTAGYTLTDGVYKITKAGTYSLTGVLENGRVVVEAPDSASVSLELNGVTITSSVDSPISCLSADSVKIKSIGDTINNIFDTRETLGDAETTLGKGAIYSKVDTSFVGKGSLNVIGSFNNGIHTTKDLKIKNTTLTVKSVNHALKGNDSVTITSGTINLYSTSGDGIKTEDSDISSKGNQRGNVTISGGTVNIYAWGDGIDASYDAIVQDGIDEESKQTTIPELNIYTNKFASEATGSSTSSTTQSSKMYIRSTTANDSNYRYAAQFKTSTGSTSWANATYLTSKEGSRNTYYYYSVACPQNATAIKVYKFSANLENSESSYVAAMSEYATLNEFYNTICISESGNEISDDSWGTYVEQSPTSNRIQYGGGGWPGGGGPGGGGPGGWGGNEGNTDKADSSAKGIKANNAITISGGKTYVKTYDDGLHANYYQDSILLENGEKGVGDVIISGGDLKVYATDDGLHADRILEVNGGNVVVENAYEGMEGSQVLIKGGTSKVYATDDGINAASKSDKTALVSISGGFLDVAVSPNGDTDGIDSNGDYVQTGGVVFTKGPNQTMMSALDWGDNNNTATVSGGTLLVFGRPGGTVRTSGSVKSSTNSSQRNSGAVKVNIDGTEYSADCYSFSYTGQYLYTDQTVKVG